LKGVYISILQFLHLDPVRNVAIVHPLSIKSNVVYAGGRVIIKEGKRFKIYLPTQFNDVWQALRGKKVKVYLVIDDEDEA